MTGPDPEITVVIPAYRAKRFISSAIDSALSQLEVSIQVLVVDDCCPDHTADAVESQYLHDPRVRTVRLAENGGPAKARNYGFASARTEWIAVLDADDAFEPGRLARLLAAARATNADVIADNVKFINAKNNIAFEPIHFSEDERVRLTTHSFVDKAHPGVAGLDLGLLKPMFRKQFLLENQLTYSETIRHGEDFNFYFDILRANARFFVIKEAGYRWSLRDSGNSQTVEDYPGQRLQALILADTVTNDHVLVRLLKHRASELMRLHYNKNVDRAKQRGSLMKELALSMKHPVFAARRYSKALMRRVR